MKAKAKRFQCVREFEARMCWCAFVVCVALPLKIERKRAREPESKS